MEDLGMGAEHRAHIGLLPGGPRASPLLLHFLMRHHQQCLASRWRKEGQKDWLDGVSRTFEPCRKVTWESHLSGLVDFSLS